MHGGLGEGGEAATCRACPEEFLDGVKGGGGDGKSIVWVTSEFCPGGWGGGGGGGRGEDFFLLSLLSWRDEGGTVPVHGCLACFACLLVMKRCVCVWLARSASGGTKNKICMTCDVMCVGKGEKRVVVSM